MDVGQAPEGQHKAKQLRRASRAVKNRALCPTVSTMGYVVRSLRDFEQLEREAPYIKNGNNYLRGKLPGSNCHNPFAMRNARTTSAGSSCSPSTA